MDCRALNRFTQICGAAAVFIWSSGAWAQRAPEDTTPPPNPGPTEQPPPEALPPCPTPQATTTPPPAPAYTAAPQEEGRRIRIFAPSQIMLTTGAGATNYFGSDQQGAVDTGAAWDARVTFGARSVIAAEAAYIGSVNNVDLAPQQVVVGGHGQVFGNGFDTDLRLNLPLVVEPYIFGGVGYNHMEVRNEGTGVAANLAGKDNSVAIPAGGGVTAYVSKHLNIDARGTYRFLPDNDLPVMGDRHVHQWVAQAHLGYLF